MNAPQINRTPLTLPTAPVAVWRLQSPAAATGAVSLIALRGEIDLACTTLGFKPVPVGGIALRQFASIDELLIARWSPTHASLMPHGGIAVTRRVLAELEHRGIPQDHSTQSARDRYPQARTELQARILTALEEAASPRAIDLLLAQPHLWHAAGWSESCKDHGSPSPRDLALQHLINPPLVVAIGPPNVGKSTIVNSLAQRRVAIVADAPGTTRDHVGVTLNLAGLVVRYVDAPGIRDTIDPIEAQAIHAATQVAQLADLLLLITDSEPASVAATERIRDQLTGRQILTVQTRADSQGRDLAADITLANMHKDPSRGAAILADAIAARLVPAEYLDSNEPWAFTRPSSLLL